MEDIKNNETVTANPPLTQKPAEKVVQAPYPAEDIKTSINIVQQIVEQKGTSAVATRNDIAVILGKAESTIILKISACVQYGLLVKSRTKDGGYISSPLYKSYTEPIYTGDEKKHMLNMFQTPTLYKRLIADLNGQILPNEIGFTNLLKTKYGINANSSERAAKVFFDNARFLNLLDANNRFRFLISVDNTSAIPLKDSNNSASNNTQEKPPNTPPTNTGNKNIPDVDDENTITIPIPMKDKKSVAYLIFPKNYTDADMDKIARIVKAYKEMIAEDAEA